MRILLDPSRDGCTIWFIDRGTVKFINGTPQEICERIYKFSTIQQKDDKGVMTTYQFVNITLDSKGPGEHYKDCLQREYGLKISLVKPEKEFTL